MLIKFLYLCLFYFFIQSMGFCFQEDILNELEYQKYGTTFRNESLAQRINKLETDILGMEQKGSIEERLDLLHRILINKREIALQTPYYGNKKTKKKSAIRNFFDNLSDIGSLTGFTPSLNSTSYNNGSYYDSYGNNNLSNWGHRAFDNFLNNQNSYCPKHNSYHDNHFNHPIHNKHFRNYNFDNNYHYPHQQAYIPQRNFYVPPNIQSRSSIRIIRD